MTTSAIAILLSFQSAQMIERYLGNEWAKQIPVRARVKPSPSEDPRSGRPVFDTINSQIPSICKVHGDPRRGLSPTCGHQLHGAGGDILHLLLTEFVGQRQCSTRCAEHPHSHQNLGKFLFEGEGSGGPLRRAEIDVVGRADIERALPPPAPSPEVYPLKDTT